MRNNHLINNGKIIIQLGDILLSLGDKYTVNGLVKNELKPIYQTRILMYEIWLKKND